MPMQNENEKPERIKFVTVCETGDPGFIAFAKSLLESEGIIYFLKGEQLQELGGMGRLGTGFNQIFGPVEIQVDEKDVERARELLDQAQQSTFASAKDTEETKPQEIKREYLNPLPNGEKPASKVYFKGIIIGIIIAVSIYYAYNYIHEFQYKNLSWMSERDSNKDGKPDVFYRYKGGFPEIIEEDLNFDGKTDRTCFYKDGIIERCETDDNFDGTFKTRSYFKNGVISRAETYYMNQTTPLITENFINGVINEAECYNESTQKIWKKELYNKGMISEELIDQNGDGKFDLSMQYNRWGRLIRINHL